MKTKALKTLCLASLLKLALAAAYIVALPPEAKEELFRLVPPSIASRIGHIQPPEENPS
jgi:hypothetical protein